MSEAGWHWLFNSTREHWFGSDGKSACGRWFTFSATRRAEPSVKAPCKACSRAVEKRTGPRQGTSHG